MRQPELPSISILLFLFGFLSLAATQGCQGYLDGADCVTVCTFPKVNDVLNGTCLTTSNDCTQFYYIPENTCLPECPSLTITGLNSDSKQLCYPFDLHTNYPAAESLTCASEEYLDLINTQCTAKSTACSGFLIPEISICVSSCPSEYNEDTLTSGTDTIQVCTPKPYIQEAVCTFSQIRDFANNVCLDSPTQCVGFLDQDIRFCYKQCPEGTTQQTVPNKSYSICATSSYNTCSLSQISYYKNDSTISCLDDLSECPSYYIALSNMCTDNCPTGTTVVPVQDQTYSLCQPTTSCTFKDAKGTCYEFCPENLTIDHLNFLCLIDSIDDCGEGEYFNRPTLSCVTQCPFGSIPSKSTKVGERECIPCTLTSEGCPNQLNLCKEKLSKDGQSCGARCPHSQYALPQQNGQTYQQCALCESDSQFVNYDETGCVTNCGTDFAANLGSRKCIITYECMDHLYTESGQTYCGRSCPLGQIEVDPTGSNAYSTCVACESGQFIDLRTKTCVSTCQIYDATKTSCLASLSDCIGYIASDNTTCKQQCDQNEVYSDTDVPHQYVCSATCPSNTYLLDRHCVKQCEKGYFPDPSTQSCVESKKCTNIVSVDGRGCVTSCGAGQFVQTDSKTNVKSCKVCNKKVSSDGMQCTSECSSTEVFDVDAKKCYDPSNVNTCSGKIYSADKKSCSTKCPKGQLLKVDSSSSSSTCLVSASSCSDMISSDYTRCVTSCQSNEATISVGSSRMCVLCAFGTNSDKSACNSPAQCNASTQLFDLDLGKCVDVLNCASKFISVDGLKCSTQCVPPELTRLSTSTTQCYSSCGSGEIRVKGKGCVSSASECTGFISAATGECIEECVLAREEIDSTTSTPKTCKQCASDQTPVIVDLNGTKVTSCQTKTNKDVSLQVTGAKDILNHVTTISTDVKSTIRTQVTAVAGLISQEINDSKESLELNSEEKKTIIKSFLDTLRNLAKAFSDKVEQTSGSSENESQFKLGTSEYSILSESTKPGYAFNVKFSLSNFVSANPRDLQVDPTTLGVDEAASQVSSEIQSLQATNLATNPYCKDATLCSSYGLFSVAYSLSSGARRRLSENDGQTFQTVYNVSSDKIKNTICVQYNEDTGEMTPAISTETDTANSTVTCTFSSNSDLYLDSSCAYIDSTYCSIDTPTNKDVITDSASSGNLEIFSIVLFGAVYALINI